MCRWKIGTGCATKCFPKASFKVFSLSSSSFGIFFIIFFFWKMFSIKRSAAGAKARAAVPFNHCGGSKSHVVHRAEVCSFINKNMVFSYSDVMFVQMNKFFKSLRSLGWNVIV
ncbi:hypothetical protein MKW92_020164 [Papaver armeniacum]|nr:hypothetical protein MKW92_020164 [Papaver armeniacum]